MIECPSCGRRCAPALICAQCGAPLGAEVDCFTAMGLPRRLDIDQSALERTYHDFSRRIHPDRFTDAPAPVRSASMRSTAMLTRAYRTLRDPVLRGLYWLELRGDKLSRNNNAVPTDLAQMVFEVQEELEELHAGLGASIASVESRRGAVSEFIADAMSSLAENFARWNRDDSADTTALVADLKSILSRIAYLRTLLRDIDKSLEHARAAHPS